MEPDGKNQHNLTNYLAYDDSAHWFDPASAHPLRELVEVPAN